MKPEYPKGFLEQNLASCREKTMCEGGCCPPPCSRLVDSIIKTRPYIEQVSAMEAVDKIPNDQLEKAWAWTATYLVALEHRISSENVKVGGE